MTMRTLPVDCARLDLIAAGSPIAAAEWVELSDGSRRPSGNQQKNDANQPIWQVEAFVPGDEGERASVIAVQVAGDEPKVSLMREIRFENLVVKVGKNRTSGAITQYWSADSVLPPQRPTPSPAAS
jgi:hypothetical protein